MRDWNLRNASQMGTFQTSRLQDAFITSRHFHGVLSYVTCYNDHKNCNKSITEDFRYMKIHIFALRWRDEIKRSSQLRTLLKRVVVNRTWKNFRPVRDLNPWPLRYRCNTLPIELTSQLGAGQWSPLLFYFILTYLEVSANDKKSCKLCS